MQFIASAIAGAVRSICNRIVAARRDAGTIARSGPVATAQMAALPARLSPEAQWDRTCGVITEALARVESMHALQRSAEQQLDAATYALQQLFSELSEVVRLPASALVEPELVLVHRAATLAPRRDLGGALAA